MTASSFIEGPVLWIVFLLFILAMIARAIVFAVAVIRASQDHNPRWSFILITFLRSLAPFHDGIPKRPLYALARYLFHGCLIAVPLFLAGHIVLWEESRFQWSWPALPDAWADIMSLIVIVLVIYFFVRRIALKEIRTGSSVLDYILLALTALPFITGYFLTHGSLDSVTFLSHNMRLIHVLSAEALILVAAVLFYQTRLKEVSCTGCASCEISCPTSALNAADTGTRRIFTYVPSQCVACGSCVKTCPEGAAELRHEISPRRLLFPVPAHEIRSVELTACERCGELFAPQAQVERVGQSVADTYLRYCPRCRGRVMLREL